MNCPKCNHETQVIDSRSNGGGRGIRRRRKCIGCDYRFTTQELPHEGVSITEKTLFGIEKISALALEHRRLVDEVEALAAARQIWQDLITRLRADMKAIEDNNRKDFSEG